MPWLGVDNYAAEVRPSELPPFRSPLPVTGAVGTPINPYAIK
jgi:hypothetical protein